MGLRVLTELPGEHGKVASGAGWMHARRSRDLSLRYRVCTRVVVYDNARAAAILRSAEGVDWLLPKYPIFQSDLGFSSCSTVVDRLLLCYFSRTGVFLEQCV